MTNPRPNPYPGPRAFQRGEPLYGRDRETAELLDLLIAERIVLLSSPSGAGKSSLVQAGLIPKLVDDEGFRVLPVMRPGGALVAPLAGQTYNRYVLSLLLALERGRPEDQQAPLANLAALTLAGYLQQYWPLPQAPGWHGDVLVFDQFEEILTVDPTDRQAKLAAFEQVGRALRDRSRWALFSMREEYVAALDPFLQPLPARFDKGRRYRLQLLGPAAAHEAMQRPPAGQKPPVRFEPAAADRLIDDLRRTQIQLPDGATVPALGDTVEPVQLQVVCRQLWDGLDENDVDIGLDDVERVGNVDLALRGYYAAAVRAAAAAANVSERSLRDWIGRQLIARGVRTLVRKTAERTQDMPNAALEALESSHLLRAEERRGATFYELAHDRLIAPVQADNAAWIEAQLTPLQRQAALWDQQKRPPGLLLRGAGLAEAERQLAASPLELEPHEQDFLDSSRREAARLAREAAMNRVIRILAVVATVVGIAALAAAFIARANAVRADANAALAQRQADLARRQAALATSRELAAAAIAALPRDPELSLLLAREGFLRTYTAEAEDALRRALQTSRIVARYDAAESLRKAVYSPDGTRLAAGSDRGDIIIWDVGAGADGKAPLRWSGGGGALMDLAYSPDAARLATAHADKAVRLWDAATGKLLHTFSGYPLEALSVAFSPDGRYLATGGNDPVIRIWELAAPDSPPAELYGNTAGVAGLAYDKDGARLASAGLDGRVMIWDPAARQPVQTVQAQGEPVYAVAFSPDGRLLATASRDQTAVIWDISGESPRRVQTLYDHTNAVSDVAFSPNGRCLATSSLDSSARVWEAATGRLLLTLPGHLDWVSSVAFPLAAAGATPSMAEPCGPRLATASRDGTARVWNIGPAGEGAVLAGHQGPVEAAAFLAGATRTVTASDDGTGRIWDLTTGKTLAELRGHQGMVLRAVVSPDGSRIATASVDGSAILWDAGTGAAIVTLKDPDGGAVRGVAFSPDGRRLATVGASGNALEWEIPAGRLVREFQHGGKVYGAAFSPDGATLVTTGEKGLIKVWDASRGDGTGTEGKLLDTLHQGAQEIYDAAFSPDGRWLATASWDGSAQLLPWPAGAPAHLLTGHRDRIYGLAFSPDGRTLATAAADGTVRLQDVQTGAALRQLPGPPFDGLDFSPDGRWLIVGADDGAAREYAVSPDLLPGLAAGRVTRGLTTTECQQYLHAEACGVVTGKGVAP